MHSFDRIGSCDAENIVITFQRDRMIRKDSAVEVGFAQALRLQHGSHGSIEDQDPFGEKLSDVFFLFYHKIFLISDCKFHYTLLYSSIMNFSIERW